MLLHFLIPFSFLVLLAVVVYIIGLATYGAAVALIHDHNKNGSH
jgi:hypothetical protein